MSLSDFDFDLPTSLIAQAPAEPRDSARLLVYHCSTQQKVEKYFYEMDLFLNAGDLLILNDTKVIPARLLFKGIELFLLEPLDERHTTWKGLCRPGKKFRQPRPLDLPEGVTAVIEKMDGRFYRLEFKNIPSSNFFQWLDRYGSIPIPPYLKRKATTKDKEDYQTVYAEVSGSVAAPTAGLHFTLPLLERLKKKGVLIETLTLQVGYGTFAPLEPADLVRNTLHQESYSVSTKLLHQIEATKKQKNKVVAVGTTTLRALESVPRFGSQGQTNIFIRPGFQFQMVDSLITNFHLPQSSLLMLVSAFAGTKETLDLYRYAVDKKYRFYSYGDAMLIHRN